MAGESTTSSATGRSLQQKTFRVPVWEGVLSYTNLWPKRNVVLNTDAISNSPSASSSAPQDISVQLRKSITTMYGQHITEDGSAVDYAGLGASDAFAEYCQLAGNLREVDVASMSQAERTCFFINAYNSLLIHAFVTLGTPSNLLSRLRMYAVASYNIGGHVYSLNDMENGVLRANQCAPTPLARVPFTSNDPRKAASCTQVDPRIHFALNCGARGCPAIRFYKPETLDTDLDKAAKSFCMGVRVDEDSGEVFLSQIFKWYIVDFAPGVKGHEQEIAVLQYVARYAQDDVAAALRKLLDSGKARLKFGEYDWSLNSKS